MDLSTASDIICHLISLAFLRCPCHDFDIFDISESLDNNCLMGYVAPTVTTIFQILNLRLPTDARQCKIS